MTQIYGVLDHSNDDVVVCEKCQYMQYEPKAKDKYAWMCRGCSTVYEGDKEHLLSRVTYPTFDRWHRRGSYWE